MTDWLAGGGGEGPRRHKTPSSSAQASSESEGSRQPLTAVAVFVVAQLSSAQLRLHPPSAQYCYNDDADQENSASRYDRATNQSNHQCCGGESFWAPAQPQTSSPFDFVGCRGFHFWSDRWRRRNVSRIISPGIYFTVSVCPQWLMVVPAVSPRDKLCEVYYLFFFRG